MAGVDWVLEQHGWVKAQGPMINFGLWMEVLNALLDVTSILEWVKVPCHIQLASNERADRIPEQGVASPLYHTVRRPVKPPITPICPTPTRAHVMHNTGLRLGIRLTRLVYCQMTLLCSFGFFNKEDRKLDQVTWHVNFSHRYACQPLQRTTL